MSAHYLKKELYELIKKEERVFEFIQEGSLDGLWYWDLENPENEWMNERFWQVLGYDPATMPHLASAWQDIIDQDDLQTALDNFHKHLETPDHAYDQNVRYRHKDGSTVWVRCRGIAIRNESGKAVRMLGAHQDLTSLKRTEIELQQAKEIERVNREKYQFILENTSDVIRVQGPGGDFEFISSNIQELTGYSVEEYLKFDADENVLPEDREMLWNSIRRLEKGDDQFSIEYRTYHKSGRVIWVQTRLKAIRDECGSLISIISTSHDITERKSIESTLKENEQRLRLTTEGTGIGIWDMNTQSRRFTFNRQFSDMIGYAADDIVPTMDWWQSIVHPDDRPGTEKRLFDHLNNRSERYESEYRVKHKSGDWIWIQDKGSVVERDEKGNAKRIVGIHINVSERKNAEKEIQKRELHLRSLIENPAGYVVYRTRFNRETGTIDVIQVSPAFTDLLGVSKEESRSFEKWFQHVHPEDLPELMAANEQGMKPPYRLSMEVRYNHPDKGLKWFELRSRGIPYEDDPDLIEYANGIILDITEKKMTEQSLRESEAQKHLILNATAEMIAYYDTDLKIVWANKAFCDTFRTEEEQTGRHCYEFRGEGGKPCRKCPALKALESKRPEKRELQTSDGKHWKVRIYPILDDSNEVIGLAEFTMNITRRKIAEAEIKQNQANLKALIENTSDMIWSVDTDYRLISANSAFLKRCESIYGERLKYGALLLDQNRLSEELYHQWKQNYDRVLSGEKFSEEIETFYSENKQFVENSYNPILDEQQNVVGISGFCRNITKRKLSEEALRKSEEKFRLLSEESGDCAWIMNEQLQFTYISPAVKHMVGFAPEEWEGTSLESHFTQKEFTRVSAIASNHIQNCQTLRHVSFESKMLNRADEEIDVEISSTVLLNQNGDFIGMQGVTRDITKRKQAEKEIRDSEARLRNIVENMPVMMAAFNEKGDVIAWNRECERVSGYSRDEMIQAPDALEKLYPDSIYRSAVSDELKTPENNFRHKEYILVSKDGSQKTILWSNISQEFPVPGWHNWAIGLDVTEHRQTREELKKYQEKLESIVQQRTRELEEKNKFLARMNDAMVDREFRIKELRDEINHIKGQTELFEE